MPRFKTGESRNQMLQFPETINDYIPEDHLATAILGEHFSSWVRNVFRITKCFFREVLLGYFISI